jgi:hypothetical protein
MLIGKMHGLMLYLFIIAGRSFRLKLGMKKSKRPCQRQKAKPPLLRKSKPPVFSFNYLFLLLLHGRKEKRRGDAKESGFHCDFLSFLPNWEMIDYRKIRN